SGKGGNAPRALARTSASTSASGFFSTSSASEKVETRAGPLPFRAMMSVFFLEETSLMKLQASSLSVALAGMTMPHASTTEDIGTLLSAEAGKPIALILPGYLDC